MVRMSLFLAIMACTGLAGCGPQPPLDAGLNPYASGPGPVAPATPPTKP